MRPPEAAFVSKSLDCLRLFSEERPEVSPEHAWGMALYSLRTATAAVCEMSRADPYRDLAVKDLGQISEAVLAMNLTWSHLKKREAA